MAKEITIEEEDFIIAENRHDEIISSLLKVANAIVDNNSNKEVVDAINGQIGKIGKLAEAIKNIPKQEQQNVNIDLNTKDLVSSINKICEDIIISNNKVIDTLNNRLLPDTFTLVKGLGGVTESVKVNYKEASKIKK